MGAAGRARVVEHFSLGGFTGKLDGIVRELAGTKRRRGCCGRLLYWLSVAGIVLIVWSTQFKAIY
jgi:hypothetical protein